jgi:hypothetical protein
MSRGKEWRRHFTAYDGNCDIDIGRAAVEWNFVLTLGGLYYGDTFSLHGGRGDYMGSSVNKFDNSVPPAQKTLHL